MSNQRAQRPERVTTILNEEETNGHGPETDPPRPPQMRPMRLSVDESVERLEEQGDIIIDEFRQAKLWQQHVDRRLDDQDGDLADLKSGMSDIRGVLDGINDRILEFIARVEDAKTLAKESGQKAEHAQREAKAARDVGERASSSNEIATSYVSRKLEQDLAAGDDLLKARRARRKLVLSWAGAIVTGLIGASITAAFAFKGCH